MLLSIAWRNVIRARRRTVVTILLSSITTLFFIFYVGMKDGAYAKFKQDAIEFYPGYIQITGPGYRDTADYDNIIHDLGALIKVLQKDERIALFAPRFEGFGLFASNTNAIGGMLAAVDPVKEPHLSRIHRSLIDGTYLTPDDTNGIVIGDKLAQRLEVKKGDTLSIIGSATDYSFAADNLVVKGIFHTGSHELDASAALINKAYFDTVFASKNMATHVVVLPKEIADSLSLAQSLQQELGENYEVVDWHTYLSGLIESLEYDAISDGITMSLFLVIILFVIMIYALLTIYSRTKEIGIMRAIGTTPLQVFTILMMETAILAGLSVIIGGIGGGWLIHYFEQNPIVLTGMEEAYGQFGIIDAVLPSRFSLATVFESMGIMFLLNLLTAFYPVYRVNRFKPIDAIRHL